MKTIEEIGLEVTKAINDLAKAFAKVGETMRNSVFIVQNYSNKSVGWKLLLDSYLGKRGIYHKDGRRIR